VSVTADFIKIRQWCVAEQELYDLLIQEIVLTINLATADAVCF